MCATCARTTGPFSRYNATVSEEQQIRPGDYILAINGVSHENKPPSYKTSDVLKSLVIAPEVSLTLKVCRPHTFEVKLEQSSQRMGLDLGYTKVSNTLIVSTITREQRSCWFRTSERATASSPSETCAAPRSSC